RRRLARAVPAPLGGALRRPRRAHAAGRGVDEAARRVLHLAHPPRGRRQRLAGRARHARAGRRRGSGRAVLSRRSRRLPRAPVLQPDRGRRELGRRQAPGRAPPGLRGAALDLGLGGKTAIVTGASKGLGRAIALELAKEGADLAICSRSDAEIKEAAEAIANETGREVFAEVCDVTDAEQISGFVDEVAAELGGLDILVNNAGRATPGTFSTITDEQMAGDYDVKVFSIIRCTRAAVPHMRRRGGGRV